MIIFPHHKITFSTLSPTHTHTWFSHIQSQTLSLPLWAVPVLLLKKCAIDILCRRRIHWQANRLEQTAKKMPLIAIMYKAQK
jgi:hypothetical protein